MYVHYLSSDPSDESMALPMRPRKPPRCLELRRLRVFSFFSLDCEASLANFCTVSRCLFSDVACLDGKDILFCETSAQNSQIRLASSLSQLRSASHNCFPLSLEIMRKIGSCARSRGVIVVVRLCFGIASSNKQVNQHDFLYMTLSPNSGGNQS